MTEKCAAILKERLDERNHQKLFDLKNPKLEQFIADAIELCNPGSVFVCSDDEEDIKYLRQSSMDRGEETPLKMEGHTIHFDNSQDQARDKANTKFLLKKDQNLGVTLNSVDKEEGLAEVRGYLKDSMVGKEMIVRLICLGPTDSVFSISAVQLTDSAYVAHSEDLLYRPGYEQFKRLENSDDFLRVLHSAGELRNSVSVNLDKRRIYVDCDDDIVYSVNTQYAGNTVGFKKLALRLTIRKSIREGWLSEHMFVMGVHGPNNRKTYFTGAFPSFCGKTSTSMIPGETIVGDDIAYLRKIGEGVNAVNVESGIFGIIQDVNNSNDPSLWNLLTNPGEVIFSNVLLTDGVPYWNGDEREHPQQGVNFAGEWSPGKKDAKGNAIPASHKNARYTIDLKVFPNLDDRANHPDGVPVGGMIFGGRDSDTSVPVRRSLNWEHGVITMGASLESETTAATIGQEGVRAFQPMSIIDFLSIPLGTYIQHYLDFIDGVEKQPVIFGSNYFLKGEDGNYLNAIKDKYVWLKWMELSVNNDVEGLVAPTGSIPKYDDLKGLFKQVLDKEYTREDYETQFTIRIPHSLAKLDRIEKKYRTDVQNVPDVFFTVLGGQRARLESAREQHGDYISPFLLES